MIDTKLIELVKPIRVTATGSVMVRSILSDSLTEVSADDLRNNPLMFAPAYLRAAEIRAGSWDGVSHARELICVEMSRADCQAALEHIEGSPLDNQRAGIKQFWSKMERIENGGQHD
jgi:hypothetical protein